MMEHWNISFQLQNREYSTLNFHYTEKIESFKDFRQSYLGRKRSFKIQNFFCMCYGASRNRTSLQFLHNSTWLGTSRKNGCAQFSFACICVDVFALRIPFSFAYMPIKCLYANGWEVSHRRTNIQDKHREMSSHEHW